MGCGQKMNWVEERNALISPIVSNQSGTAQQSKSAGVEMGVPESF